MPDRKSALEYLKSVAGTADPSFFSLQDDREQLSWNLEGEELKVTRRSYSRAQPTTIMYDIDLGTILPQKKGMPKDFLVIYVLYPKEHDLAANRAAYKRCLDDLIANEASFTAQRMA